MNSLDLIKIDHNRSVQVWIRVKVAVCVFLFMKVTLLSVLATNKKSKPPANLSAWNTYFSQSEEDIRRVWECPTIPTENWHQKIPPHWSQISQHCSLPGQPSTKLSGKHCSQKELVGILVLWNHEKQKASMQASKKLGRNHFWLIFWQKI